ncbi:MAG TPA: hypothetical protein VH475_22585 [Tepidisphaeraceae bacterium]|jgi:hypothetical protein
MDALPAAVCRAVRPLEYAGPFSPPIARRVGIWRDGPLLVMFAGSPLPPRCITCGDDHARRLRLRLSWLAAHMRWLGSFAFIVLGFARAVELEVGLCDCCRARRERACRTAVLLLALGIILLILALWDGSEGLGVAASFALVGAGILVRRSRPLTVRRIDRNVVQLAGAGAAFLSGLPIGGPPGIGVTSDDLADRLCHVRDRESGRRRRKRRRRRCRTPQLTTDHGQRTTDTTVIRLTVPPTLHSSTSL